MSKKTLAEFQVRCPSCERTVRPWLLEFVPGHPGARPPIPDRHIVKCAARGCGEKFYVPVNDA